MRNALRERVIQASKVHRSSPISRFSVHSGSGNISRILPATLAQLKRKQTKIAMITAYDYPTSCIAHGISFTGMPEEPNSDGIGNLGEMAGEESSACLPDILLVGDSVGQVVLGHESTSTVTLQHMLHHTAAVSAARRHPGVRKHPLIVTDLPFGSFRDEPRAVDAAIQSVQVGGAGAVKIEGAGRNAQRVASVTAQGIAVMGHIGLLPQTAEASQGGFRVQGKTARGAAQLVADAIALQEAGACSLVLELVPWQLADIVSHAVHIPVIGIGAGAAADGQVLVWHDFMGINPNHVPRFVQQYMAAGAGMQQALRQYVGEVRKGFFPGPAHSTRAKQETLRGLLEQFTSAMQSAPMGADAQLAALDRALCRTGQLLEEHTEGTPGTAGAQGSTSSNSSRPAGTTTTDTSERKMRIPLSAYAATKEGSGAVASSRSNGFRVAIVGSGAVAQLLVSTLGQQPGVKCVLVPSREKRFRQLQQRGALDVSLQGGLPTSQVKPALLAYPGHPVGELDAVIVACKGQYTQRVLRDIVVPLITGSTASPLLVSAQNGIAPLQALANTARAHACAAAVCVQSHGALMHSNGHVQHTGKGDAQLGLLGSNAVSNEQEGMAGCLAELLQTSGLASTPQLLSRRDTHTAVAKKFAVNCALNASTVLLNAPNGALLDLGAEGRALLAEAAREAVLAVQAGAKDIAGDADWDSLLGGAAEGDTFAAAGGWQVAQRTAGNTSSTLADVQRGTDTESMNDWAAEQLPEGCSSTNGQLAAAVRCIAAVRRLP